MHIVNQLASHYNLTATRVDVAVKYFAAAQPKFCFYNAKFYLDMEPKASYILGYITMDGLPLEHAWVREDDHYYDVTLSNVQNLEYWSLFECTKEQLAQIVYATGVIPSLYECYKFHKTNIMDNV